MKLSLFAGSLAFIAALSLARAADAPPTDDEARWRDAASRLAAVLGGTAEREALAPLVSDHSWVSPFARNRTEAVGVLAERLGALPVVSVRACLQPSVSSATDLVADVMASPFVADSVRKRVAPAEGRDLRQADATMARWFATALEAQSGDPVALIALYDPGQATPDREASPTLVLLLVRGEFDATGQPRISRVLYGTLEEAVK